MFSVKCNCTIQSVTTWRKLKYMQKLGHVKTYSLV